MGRPPASYEYNLNVTREVVKYAHDRGVTVEGEIGCLGGIEDGVGSGEVMLADPDQALEFGGGDKSGRPGFGIRHESWGI